MIDPSRPDFSRTPVSPLRPRYAYAPADSTASPCVSIVTPFFNTGAVFHETARSVLGQSLQQFEWIIVNDGSSDPESLEMLAQYRTGDRRIRVVDLPRNRGLSAARNAGFAAARAAYVLQLDADDLLEPTAAEKLWWFLETHPECAFASGHSVHFGAIQAVWTGGFHEGAAFLASNRVNATCLIRTAIHHDVGGYDEGNRGGLEDWEFWLRCANRGHWGGTVPECLDWYRRRPHHEGAWSNWDSGESESLFRARLQQRYPRLWTDGLPSPVARRVTGTPLNEAVPAENVLAKPDARRLLLIVPWLSLGGADRFNLDLIDGLSARGWEITVVATLNGPHPWLPLFAKRTPDVFLLSNYLPVEDYPRFFRYLLKSRGFDGILVANSEAGYLLAPYLGAHANHAVLASYCHALDEDWKDGGYPRMAVETSSLLDHQLVASGQIAEWMAARGCDARTIQVLPVSIDTDRWKPDAALRTRVRAELGVGDDDLLILTAARISSEKQPDVLARVWQALRDRGVGFRAVVAGDGPELPALQRDIADFALDAQVSLLGAISPDRMRAVLSAADICFLPSRREGIALACFEAMSAGVAVVSADVGAQRELIVPGTGILIESADPQREVDQYVEVLSRLAADGDARRRMSEAARARVVEHFRLAAMHDRLDAILRAPGRAGRAAVPAALASIFAARAVEHIRLNQTADELWAQRGRQPAVTTPPVEWVVELQNAKQWLEDQCDSWRSLAETREHSIVELKAWIDQLEEGKRWLEAQNAALLAEIDRTSIDAAVTPEPVPEGHHD
jgi:glycosyltransferase involved in cell wall biosynthesis